MPIHHDRRRRVLVDDASLSTDSDEARDPAGKALATASGLRYASAAQRENQTRLADLVPTRPLPFVLMFGLGLTLIAGLLTAYSYLPQLAVYVPAETLSPLDLKSDHSLANWLSLLLLLTNMQFAVLVFSLRRHRVDDYHGRYRIWLAMAVASLAASVDLATGVYDLLKVVLAPAARWCGLADHFGVGIALGMVGLYLAVRLVFESRRSWGSLTTFGFAALCLFLPIFLPSAWLQFAVAEHETMLRTGIRLTGYLTLLTGTMLFARHVMLDVDGKLPERTAKPPKPAKPKKAKLKLAETPAKEATAPAAKAKPRTDLDPPARPVSPAKPAAAAPAKPVASARDEDDDDDESSDTADMRNMSRADRKRLKREMKLARRDAA